MRRKAEGGGWGATHFNRSLNRCGNLWYNLTIKHCSDAPFVFYGSLSGTY